MVNRREFLAISSALALQGQSRPAFDRDFGTALQAAEAIRRGRVSSVELTQHAFARMDRFEPKLNAFSYETREEALAAAKEADAAMRNRMAKGPFHGVPITIKESFGVAGRPATWGIPQLKDSKAPRHSAVAQKMADTGAVLLGGTNVPVNLSDYQSDNPIYGRSNNPWDVTRTPGGSSGGSAAALAAGLGYLSIGSDIGGSLRVPAHFCGIFSHKPTIDVISQMGQSPGGNWGLPGYSTDLAVAGPMARSAEDLMEAMRLLGGPDPGFTKGWSWKLEPPRRSRLSEFRVGYLFDDPIAPVTSEMKLVFDSVSAALGKAGLQAERGWPQGFEPGASLANYLFLLGAVLGPTFPPEQAAAMMRDSTNPMGAGMGADHRRWTGENMKRLRTRQVWQKYFESFDVFLCPVAFTPAFPHDASPDMAARTIGAPEGKRPYLNMMNWIFFATVAGLPATVMPVGRTASGLPVGLQIVGPMWEDATPIQFASLLAERLGGFTPPPGFLE